MLVDMDTYKHLGENFGRIRKRLGLTQEQVSDLTGLSQQYLSTLERGQQNATLKSLLAIGAGLEIDYLELLLPPDMELRKKR
ncbi:helix-turn-helix domain-containing protein [Labrys okinawensis]|uniref:helix-turn-helix domain-containing protein n=1 Tax=Labrys okinawensis TaxID=346911 RepID=UPI0039BD488A